MDTSLEPGLYFVPSQMLRTILILAVSAVSAFAAGCRRVEHPAPAVELTAIDLHRAFIDDAAAARDSFADKTLLISGEVAIAERRFRGTTMEGEVEVEPKISFRTELDTLPTDIKYVVVEGSFDAPDPDAPWTLDPRIEVGSTARVQCPGSTIRWTDPGLYLSECSLALE
jgi:hypothetical protein